MQLLESRIFGQTLHDLHLVDQSPETSEDEAADKESEPEVERTSSGRVRRSSAKLAAYHLHEIVADELARESPRRKIQRDLVPDDDKVKRQGIRKCHPCSYSVMPSKHLERVILPKYVIPLGNYIHRSPEYLLFVPRDCSVTLECVC